MHDHHMLDHANDTIARRHAEADRFRLVRTGHTEAVLSRPADSPRRRRTSRGPLDLVLARVPFF